MNKKALRANDAHSREDEDRRERPRSARECAEAHSFYMPERVYSQIFRTAHQEKTGVEKVVDVGFQHGFSVLMTIFLNLSFFRCAPLK